jgi:ABC-type nitrate/sulfonate/bicarbonate transport system substrate-binding protein
MIGRRDFLTGVGSAGIASTFLAGRSAAQQPAALSVKGVYAAPGLSFSAIFLADRMGLWAKNGVTAELKQVQGGPLSMVALTNHEAQFAGVASTDPVVGWEKGIKTVAIGAFTGSLAMQFTARKDWMSRLGVSPAAPLEGKLKAFKGARIGASTIGGGPAQYTRYLARSAGIDPERDMKILAVGFGAARMAALRTNQVDVTVGDAPEADQVELEGFGELFLNCAHEVPLFREFPYTVALVTPELANERPELVRRVARTLGQANDMFATRFGEAVDILKQQFASVPPKAMERALERDRDSYPRGCRMTATMWENNIKVALDTRMISAALPTREGELWTNKFLG